MYTLHQHSVRLSQRQHHKSPQVKPSAELASDTLTSMNNLGTLLIKQGKHEEALKLLTSALDERRKLLGPTHHDTIISLNNLASLHLRMEQQVEAEACLVEVVRAANTELGSEHPSTKKYAHTLASLWARKRGHTAQNKWQAALWGNAKFRQMTVENMRERYHAE